MSEAALRRARPSDLPAALELWRALHREHEAQDERYRLSDDAPARWGTDFRTWARSDSDRIWLAERADRAVGLLTAHLYEAAPTYVPSLFVYVDDLYVVPEARGAGVGGRLLEEARAWGRANRAPELRVGVLAANGAGRAFWQKHGAVDYSVTVTLRA